MERGFYEILVGMVKRALKKTLGKSKVTVVQLTTIISEIEAVINNRPLTYLDDDINSVRALCPAHFLSINVHTGVPQIEEEYNPRETTSSVLLDKWRKGQGYLDKFWEIWTKEYLQGLRENQNLQMRSCKGEVTCCPQVGELVIVKEEGLPRGSWKMAKISKLINSEIDEVPRAAELVLSSGRYVKRPFRLLYPLECKDDIIQ